MGASWSKILDRMGRPTPTHHSFSQITRLSDLSYGIKIWTDLFFHFVTMHVFYKTHRQTAFLSLDHAACIACSAVKSVSWVDIWNRECCWLPDRLRDWVPDCQSSNWKCSVIELGSRPWYSEIAEHCMIPLTNSLWYNKHGYESSKCIVMIQCYDGCVFIIRSSATRFRLWQKHWNTSNTWAMSSLYVGQQCLDMCHGHGLCVAGHCRFVVFTQLLLLSTIGWHTACALS